MPRRRPSKKTLKEDPIGDTTEDPEKVSSKGEEKPPFRKRFKEYVMSHKTKFIIALLILLLAMGGILLWYLLDEDVSASAVQVVTYSTPAVAATTTRNNAVAWYL
jgi:hypothetical protein